MRLIDADAIPWTDLNDDMPGTKIKVLITFADKVNRMPTIEERKKGKWIHDGYDFPHGNDWIHCSECGKRGINVPADLTNFCPNCGADMRGEGHEND